MTILEYLDIENLSNAESPLREDPFQESRKLILEREQHYIDSFSPEYNILKTVGSSLGYIHSEETLLKMRESQKRILLSDAAKAKLNIVNIGENNPFFGKRHPAETQAATG